MTEEEWLACKDPTPMLEFLHDRASERKLRLLAVECCRAIRHLLSDDRSRKSIDAAELWADRQITYEQLAVARVLATYVGREHQDDPIYPPDVWAADAAKCTSASDIRAYLHSVLYGVDRVLASESGEAPGREKGYRVVYLRDIFGNPFRPIFINTVWLAWKDGTIPKLAQTIYDDRAFDRLPVLADALEEAGCTDPDILSHCRGPGPHVRGCWVVDLLLGRV